MVSLLPSWSWKAWLLLIWIIANVGCFLTTDTEKVTGFRLNDPLCYEYGLCRGNVSIAFAPMWFAVAFVHSLWENGILHDNSSIIVRAALAGVFYLWPIVVQHFGFTMCFNYIYREYCSSQLRKEQARCARIHAIEGRNIADQEVKIAEVSERLAQLKATIYDSSTARRDLYKAMGERTHLVADMSADNVDWLVQGMSKEDPGYERISKRVEEHAAIWKERKEQHFARGKSVASWFGWVEKHICTGPLVLEREN